MSLTPIPPDPAVIEYIETDPEWAESIQMIDWRFFELKTSHDLAMDDIFCSDECGDWLHEDDLAWQFHGKDRDAFVRFLRTGNHRAGRPR